MMSAFQPVGFGSGKLVDLTGFTRYGKAHSPSPYIIGRHESKEKIYDGPAACSPPDETGKYAPKAIIFSRPKLEFVGHGSGKLQNIYGMTRFGRANPPRPVLLGRHQPKDKMEPGPGAYDPAKITDRRVGILIRGRLKAWEPTTPQPGPNAYLLPDTMGQGPAFSLVKKYPDLDISNSSPGPIYSVPPIKKKGKSLTFKPFPPMGRENEPGPMHYGTLPGEQAIKQTLIKFPCVKFGPGFCGTCEYEPPTLTSDGPGPAAFNTRENDSMFYTAPKAVLTSRPKLELAGCGGGKFQNLFGKTRFGPNGKSSAVVASRHLPKEKVGFTLGPGQYDPYGKQRNTRIGITIKSRLKGLEHYSPQPGPGAYEIPGAIGKGPKFSLGLKYKGDIPILDKVPKMDHTNIDECTPQIAKSAPALTRTYGQNENPELIDVIPWLEKLLLC